MPQQFGPLLMCVVLLQLLKPGILEKVRFSLAKFKSHALEALANTGTMINFGGTVQAYDW